MPSSKAVNRTSPLSLINFPAKRSASLDMLKVMGKIDAALTLIDERLGR